MKVFRREAPEGLMFPRQRNRITTGRVGDWIQCCSGTPFYPLDPQPEEMHIEDIAHALSMLCRYGGHVARFYSVAEHSIHVSHAVPPEHALWGLLHDASEAYLVDIPRPIRRFIAQYYEWEAQLMATVCERFGLEPEMPASVREVDNRMLATERAVLMAPCEQEWSDTGAALPGVQIECWYPGTGKKLFLDRFYELTYLPVPVPRKDAHHDR